MKIYISGPMLDDGKKTTSAFKLAEQGLQAFGFETINPWEVPMLGEIGWIDYLVRNLLVIHQEAEAIYLMKGWEDDTIASIEFLVAEQLDLAVFVEEYPEGKHRNAIPKFKRKGHPDH